MIASDGVFETRNANKEFFGLERAFEVINKYRSCSSADIVDRVYRAACDFAGTSQLDDDLTVVIIKGVTRKRPASEETQAFRN